RSLALPETPCTWRRPCTEPGRSHPRPERHAGPAHEGISRTMGVYADEKSDEGVVSNGLVAVRRAARQSRRVRFTALLHHITVDLLKQSYLALERDSAPGTDGVSP